MMDLLLGLLKLLGIIVGILLLIYVIFKLVRNKHSEGEFFWDDGSRYQGQVNYYGINGYGTMSTASGDVYRGHFKQGFFNGKGLYIWYEGATFDGVFSKGKPISGLYTDVNGNIYQCRYAYKSYGARITKEFALIKQGENVNGLAEVVEQPEIECIYLDYKNKSKY